VYNYMQNGTEQWRRQNWNVIEHSSQFGMKWQVSQKSGQNTDVVFTINTGSLILNITLIHIRYDFIRCSIC
jgi:hypothetical protein